MVFQDPYASLNPRLSVAAQIGEPILIHGLAQRAAIADRVAALLETVGLDPSRAGAYPHEFSGGQRQRIAIARALAAQPDLIVADEAVSALDVSIRAQILNLLADLKDAAGLTMIFVSHDLGVVRHLANRIAVMFRGRVVELGPAHDLFRAPRHPYTRALLSAMPIAQAGRRRPRGTSRIDLDGEATRGCAYAPRCAAADATCRAERPPLDPVAPAHASACFHAGEVAPFDDAPAHATATAERLRRLQMRFATSEPATAGPARGEAVR
jgi:oligopeptide/dipeptide ABC transporter ATP-binding protein